MSNDKKKESNLFEEIKKLVAEGITQRYYASIIEDYIYN